MVIMFKAKKPVSDKEEAKIQEMIRSDPDNPELTDEQLRKGRPFREAFPDLAESIARAKRGRPKAEHTKTPVTIRLDHDIVDHYKSSGRGWQGRMNDDLRKVAKLK